VFVLSALTKNSSSTNNNHGGSQEGTRAIVPKIYHFYNFSPILPILEKGRVVLRRGDVIETQTIILYLRDMHNNNVHITQSWSST